MCKIGDILLIYNAKDKAKGYGSFMLEIARAFVASTNEAIVPFQPSCLSLTV